MYQSPGSPQTYFNRTDVKQAMHAPLDHDWYECQGPVFIGDGGPQSEGDISLDPIQKVLPQVIEATNRVLISHGDYVGPTVFSICVRANRGNSRTWS